MPVWLDDTLVPDEHAVVPVTDRGFLLGDAVFETLRAYDGEPFMLDAHLARLRESAAYAALSFDEGAVRDGVAALLAVRAEPGDSVVRITLTGGDGGRGATRAADGRTRLVVTATDAPRDDPATRLGITLACTDSGVAPASVPGDVKASGYLARIVARRLAVARGADDALLVTAAGSVIGAPTANVVIVTDGAAMTPPAAFGALAGVTLSAVTRVAAEDGTAVTTRAVTRDDVAAAHEVFLTSSVAEIVPVTRVDGTPVGRGRPGPVTRRLAAALRARAVASTRSTGSTGGRT